MALWSLTFAYTGAAETWFVPRHAAGTLTVTVAGGKGHDASVTGGLRASGGSGGIIAGVLDVTEGTPLTLIVGGGSPANETARVLTGWGPYLGGEGGDGGTGSDTNAQGGGGGAASEIRLSSNISDRIVVAGGGGGGAGKSGFTGRTNGGHGGSGIGDGSTGDPSGNRAGVGATTSAVGAGGVSRTAPDGSPGSSGVGGAGASSSRGGGGGGGGYYGAGGGGSASGTDGGTGGGGSSWANTSYLSTITGGANSAPGYITIEWDGDEFWVPRRGRRGLGLIRGPRG